MPYSLGQVLAIGQIHPFYNSEFEYPPNPEAVQTLQAQETEDADDIELNSFGILSKKALSRVTDRLINDLSPINTFRQREYMSLTGGGSGSQPVPFMTDTLENRKQRTEFGQFLRRTGLVKDGDWLITVHYSGDLYRSLDLTSETMENAGATVLSAGHYMTNKAIVEYLQIYHVNVLSGESNQIAQIVHYISTLPKEKKALIKLNKIIFTSEVLSRAQRTLVRSVLGEIEIYSVLGSAEAGPWAIHNPNLTGSHDDTCVQNFVFDSRSIKIEIFPVTMTEGQANLPKTLPEGEQGLIVQTSLSRLRNPLIRYNTGDIGSVHPFPKAARRYVRNEEWQDLRVIRLRGRDQRYGFMWDAVTFEKAKVTALLEQESFGILQWQVILDHAQDTKAGTLELRLMCIARDEGFLPYVEMIGRFREFFVVYPHNEHRFKASFVDDLSQFERSVTGRKIIKFVNRINLEDA
ncbi:MAG: hypothetical protein GOMPHAMPRED_006346 [Gomphillus americanus]|uniref:Uncharacterized protein n=1 Tax=Gomphillus americanus TaxID=1940652 RepID=A0A8H3ELW6_9LECA|nr:MAG: hypothetical protein GOMPHAMPRED_006346 [Gomphillus americanus]